MTRKAWLAAVAAAALLPWAAPPAQAADGPALTVDPSASRHAISPYVYGMNFADEALAKELRLPVRRWGGNATSRYNYLYDETNRGSDWYFENVPGPAPDPAKLPDGSETDQFTEQDRRTGTDTLLTVPLIGWTPKGRDYTCGFGIAKYGPQQGADTQWRPDCGNGVKPDGTNVTGNDPADTSVPAGPEYVTDWLSHLTGKYGRADGGGVRFYDLDNEPDLWHATHRDVHPDGAGYDEMRRQTYAIASAVKAADPGAKTLGPVGWGFQSLTLSGLDKQTCDREGGDCWSDPPDRAAHGGLPFADWYLRQMKAYEEEHGTRILDYFDEHIYPQQAGVSSTDPGDAATQELRLRSTRQLWDPSYTDESWINQPINFIPRMRDLVEQNYPGTKLAITEYNWGALGHLNGALAQADVLGIFGREGLDLATLWAPPGTSDPGAYAFRMYRNYDGAGASFGETSVRASSADQGRLAVYAAERSSDKALTLMIVNKSLTDDLTSTVSIAGRSGSAAGRVYRYSGADQSAIVRAPDVAVGADGFTSTFPASSITLVEIPADDGPAASACEVGYTVQSQWGSGFTAQVTVANTGASPVSGWTLGFSFTADQRVTQGWNAAWAQKGPDVTARNLDWNRTIRPGDSVTIGFNGSSAGTNPPPTAFTLNGAPCTRR
ncbi:glycoside hydrolase family 44 protein [Actinomadura sp. K4S16]|uniref:glycoside hydrolase family 44 protein n=1 Tax=Actinomadura sp. K4S16 TaxID=1316147 RepID=UPI0011F06099|nr:glycoside hydrolase family 44 protein [Actinomadura sp. K4S16]